MSEGSSLSYLAETPLKAGPINFLFNLWHEAQLALKRDFPLEISISWAEIFKEKEKRKNAVRTLETDTCLISFKIAFNKVVFTTTDN